MSWEVPNIITNLRKDIEEARESGGSIATTDSAGIVKPDGTTITIMSDGTISAVGSASESVSVTADGVKTYNELLGNLWALIDFTKISPKSYIVIDDGDRYNIFKCTKYDKGGDYITYSVVLGTTYHEIRMASNINIYTQITISSTIPSGGGSVYTQTQSIYEIPDEGTVYTLYY